MVSETMQAVLLGLDGVSIVLGLLVSYVAFLGWRRNRSRSVLFVAVGFVLVVGVPGALFVVFLAVPAVGELAVGLLTQLSEVAGMACILYGIWSGAGS